MPKQYRGMAADVRALTAYVKLLRAGEGVYLQASRLLALYDLTPGQFGVLEVLYRIGPQDLSELSRKVFKGNDNLNLIVENLRKRGFARRNAASRNRRHAVVVLTPKGRNLVRSILPGHAASIVTVMARLSPREQETLGRLCQKLSFPSAARGAGLAAQPFRRVRSRAS